MKKILAIFLFYIFSFNSVFANLYFSEIMPNTTDDKNLEYIEITNSWEEKINLQWYKIKDKSGKEFDFGYGDFIDSNESKKFYRTKTKILLNNTNEELYLYDNLWNLIDSFSYSTSTKWQAIIINNTDENQNNSWSVNNQTSSGTISENTSSWTTNNDNETTQNTSSWNLDNTSSWTTQNSNSWTINNANSTNSWTTQNTSSWNLDNSSSSGSIENTDSNLTSSWTIDNQDSNSENNNEDNEQIPKIKVNFSFQNPSYVLDKTPWKQEYICDENKDECKINLDLRNSFSGSLKESDFNCEIDFGLSWWTNGQEHKCNPNTVIFPKWTFEIKMKISSKTDPNNFDTKSFILKNNPKTEIIYKDKIVYKEKIIYKTSSCSSYNNVDKEVDNKVDNDTSLSTMQNNTSVSKINISNPIIEIQSWIKDWKCIKTDCSVNLIYKPKNKLERCLWNFWNWTFKTKDTDKKCNPWYVKFPIWNHKITLKVYQKDLESNYKLSYLNFSNFPKNTKNDKQGNNKIIENNTFKKDNTNLLKNEKIIDFKVDKNNKINQKNNEEIVDININFSEFEEKKDIVDNVDKKETKQQKIYKTKSKIIYFTDDNISKNIVLKDKYSQEVKISSIKAEIKVQWKIWKNKKLKGNTLSCFWTCSVNFDLETNSKDIKKYFWDFWNWKTFVWKNPSYIKYEKFWKYKVSLSMLTKSWEKLEKEFFINFYPKPKLAKTYKKKVSKKLSNKKSTTKKKTSSYLIASPETCKPYFPTIPKSLTRLQNFMYFLLFVIFILMWIIVMQKRNLL